jgi:hypothetical protein
MIKIKKFEVEDYSLVHSFYENVFNKHEIEAKATAFKWIQSGNPFNDQACRYLLIIQEKSVLGYWGIMPFKFFYFGEPFWAAFSQEALIDPRFRSKGLAGKLVREVNRCDRFLISLWHNEKVLNIAKSSGWDVIGVFKPLKKIFAVRNIIKSKIRSDSLAAIAQRSFEAYSLLRRRKKGLENRYDIDLINKCDSEFDNFFYRVAPKFGILSDRSADTLNWKYNDIPNKSYTMIAARKKGHLVGYFVLRIQAQTHLTKGIIVDLLVDPEELDALSCLIDESDRIFLENDIDFSACQVSSSVFRDVLKSHGYYEGANKRTNSLLCYNRERAPNAIRAKDIRNWYFTYGESDGDMW